QPLAQLRHSHNLAQCAEQGLMRQHVTNSPQQIQCAVNSSAPGDCMLELKLVTVSLSKSRQLIVGQSKYFSQHTDDFVARVWIDHDREQRRKPRIRRMLGLPITF